MVWVSSHLQDMSSLRLALGRHSELERVYAVTATTFRRERLFSDHACATILAEELHRLANDGSIDPMTWVVMPDHLHWLFALRKGSLGGCMHLLKGRSANAINRAHGRSGPVWQAGYFDHAIRNGESLRRHAQYMIENPIRAGLVAEITAYPYWWCAWDEPFANTSR